MLSTLIFFLLICALSVNNLAACETDLPKNCNCSMPSFKMSNYLCKDDDGNSLIGLSVPHWGASVGEVMFWCEKESVSKEWYNSLKGIKEKKVGAKLEVSFVSCPIPDEPIEEFLVKKVDLSLTISEIFKLYIQDVKNFDPSVSTNLFANLPKLKAVQFKNTNLQNIPSNFFQPLSSTSSFTTIILSRNNLSRINFDTFKNLEFLQRIDLSENDLSKLEDGTFSKLYKLQVLSLNDNHLRQLSSNIFENLTDLRSLYLQNNNLATLTREVFKPLRKLVTLNLKSNGITFLNTDIFEDLHEMRFLDLASNQISSAILPKLISNMPNLEEINLEDNGITQLAEDTFSKSPELKTLYLELNQLTELPETLFHKSVKLERIDLSFNKLITLKETYFEKLEKLRALWLNRNRLMFIPANAFKNLKNLYILVLENNRLTSLPDKLFDNLSVSAEISLDNNPWVCNCDAKYLLSLLTNSSKVSVLRSEDVKCANSGLVVNSLSLQQLCPETKIGS